MPIAINPPTVFPVLTAEELLEFQFSSWFPRFSALTIKSTVIKPLSDSFRDYLVSDGVFVPEGSEDVPAESTLSDDEASSDESDSDDDDYGRRKFAFPELDVQIRKAISNYGAVFPKLNFSSPRDAAWVLPASSPLRCTSPADVYLLLKSSDFVSHDLNPEAVFENCEIPTVLGDHPNPATYELELVLRKWYPVDRGREFRCFVRREVLLGISQRDPNYYPYMNENGMGSRVVETIKKIWEDNVKGKWESTHGNYVFDILMTRDTLRGHILDFNPYALQTDSLLFTYDELFDLFEDHRQGPDSRTLPVFRAIDSPSHPAANNNAPLHQHNMVPFEALTLSTGRDIEEFSDLWKEEIAATLT